MIDTTIVVPSEGRIKLRSIDPTPDARTRKLTAAEMHGILLLHTHTTQELRDVFAKYGLVGDRS